MYCEESAAVQSRFVARYLNVNGEIKRLFDLVSQFPTRERSQLLLQSCPDPSVRSEVESLLHYGTGGESLFDAAVRSVASSLSTDGYLSPGDRVGAYRIVSLIGHGGMGTVYLAERADGVFEQRVALKVLQSGNAESLVDRFQQERRILALLNHPNIARILDAGQTCSGLPWFVMEYVPGDTIDRFCAKKNLTTTGTLELFLRVCDAVRHAHQSLIVHRDLKPANIFVTEGGEPKLLDFGIAKVLDPMHLNSASTRMLTPEYASPEQIRGDPITTATDIYSLGAVLYKLLTGSPPHSLRDIAPLSAARTITEEEVPAASTVQPGIPDDVDSILQKALHKDPVRRYRSVEAFARDIRHCLEGRPVLARPDRFGYRARRFLRRNALIVTLSALTALFLVAATIVAIDQARRAHHRFQQVRQLANVFLFDFERAIENVPGTLEARRLVAATAQRYLEQLAADSRGDAALQREIATAWERLSEIQTELQSGRGSESEIESLRRAYDIRRALGDDRSGDITNRGKFINLASRLAVRYQALRNAAEAGRWADEATRLASDWVKAEPARREPLEAARMAFIRQGLRLETVGQAARSRQSMEEAVRFAERAWQIDTADPDATLSLVLTETIIADLLVKVKDPSAALAHAKRAVALSESLHRRNPANQRWRREYLQSLSSEGIVHEILSGTDVHELSLSRHFLERAHSLASSIALEDPTSARAKDDLAVQCQRLASVLIRMGKPDAAVPLFEQSRAAVAALTSLNPRNRRYWYLMASNQNSFGRLVLQQGRIAEAQALLLSSNTALERGLALDASDARLLDLRASQLELLAMASEKLGDLETARDRMRQCISVITAMIDRDPSSKNYIDDYSPIIALARRMGVSTSNLPQP